MELYGWQERQAVALERIADTLDDYMEMSLSLQGLMAATQSPDTEHIFKPMTDSLQEIREARDRRRYYDR